MSKEAMKLALEALAVKFSEGWHEGIKIDASDIMLLNDAAQALAEPDFWEGYVPEPDKRQQALDKKAENARELGLDYEPAQQEPVAMHEDWYDSNSCGHCGMVGGHAKTCRHYTSPPAQRTWVGLSDLNIDELENNYMKSAQTAHEFLRAIEAKLKEKNNG